MLFEIGFWFRVMISTLNSYTLLLDEIYLKLQILLESI